MTTTELQVSFNIGDFVVIGYDVGQFDFAKVNNIDGDQVPVTYCKLAKGCLDTWGKGG